MSRMKNQLSKNSDNYISKHRYLELQHFCLQYAELKQRARELLSVSSLSYEEHISSNCPLDMVAIVAEKRERYLNKVRLIEDTCREVSEECYAYILAAVAHGYTYDQLYAKYGVLPCGENKFYWMRRRVYKLLDEKV